MKRIISVVKSGLVLTVLGAAFVVNLQKGFGDSAFANRAFATGGDEDCRGQLVTCMSGSQGIVCVTNGAQGACKCGGSTC